jgi:hypothetical protein
VTNKPFAIISITLRDSINPGLKMAQRGTTSNPEYPLGVPSKFDQDGIVQSFPGNTIVSHLSPSSALYASLLVLHEKLLASSFSPILGMLPAPSWHMTVFEGVCDQVRQPSHWPSDLPLSAPLEECTELFKKKLAGFDLGAAQPPYHLVVSGLDALKIGISLRLELRTAAEGSSLRGLRDRLADELGYRHPSHDVYRFHLSIAYLLRHLTAKQEEELTALLMEHFESMPREFELGAPEFCTFEDMFAFKRLFYLGGELSKGGN